MIIKYLRELFYCSLFLSYREIIRGVSRVQTRLEFPMYVCVRYRVRLTSISIIFKRKFYVTGYMFHFGILKGIGILNFSSNSDIFSRDLYRRCFMLKVARSSLLTLKWDLAITLMEFLKPSIDK